MQWIGAIIFTIACLQAAYGRPSPLLFSIGSAFMFIWYFFERETPIESHSDDDTDFPNSPPLEETSSDFDLPEFADVLKRISKHVESGFPPRTVNHVATFAERLRHNEERHLQYEVRFQKKLIPLHIVLFKDDPDAVGAYFHTHPELVKIIESEIDSAHEEHGG